MQLLPHKALLLIKSRFNKMAREWKLLGDVLYRKVLLSPMHWNVDLTNYVVAASSYGGPIALMEKSLQATRFKIDIFSATGKQMETIEWNGGRMVKMGWSSNEELLCLQEDGHVLIYNIFGQTKGHFSMGKDANEAKVIDGKIFTTSNDSTGVIVLTSTNRFYLVTDIYNVTLECLTDLSDHTVAASCWCVVNTGSNFRILAAKKADICTMDTAGISSKQRIIKTDPNVFYTEMNVSLDNRYLALFTNLGILWIGSSDLKETYCEFDTGNLTKPDQLVWCGKNAVVAKWSDHLLLVGSTKNSVKFEFYNPFHMVPERDGIRIVGETVTEFLQKVPKELENVFRIGAVTPEIMLFEASKLSREEKKRSYEYIKIIKDDLLKASLGCLKAASYEFDSENQKALLRAAAFGKRFLSYQRQENVEDMCQKLRILNELRSVGIVLTVAQLNHLTLEILIERLMTRKLFWFAFEVCKYLKTPSNKGTSKVLFRWACDMIQFSKIGDDQLLEAISTKLTYISEISYTKIINKAIECNRSKLALGLIHFDPSATGQMSLLMALNGGVEALSKAIECGNHDLASLLFDHLKNTLESHQFLKTISRFPTISSHFASHFYLPDNHFEDALRKAAKSYENNQSYNEKISNLIGAQKAFEMAKKDTFTKLTEEQIELMRCQLKLELELGRTFFNKTLNETLHDLLINGNVNHFEQLRKEFGISDKKTWSMRVRSLVEKGDWAELDKLLNNESFPFEVLIDLCIKYNKCEEAKNYLPYVQPKNLMKYQVKLGQIDKNDIDSKCPLSFRQKLESFLSLLL